MLLSTSIQIYIYSIILKYFFKNLIYRHWEGNVYLIKSLFTQTEDGIIFIMLIFFIIRFVKGNIIL